ncbi:MAG TPA: hypothetical protein VFU63_07665, partial [Ktedonobacterales bacterium]|nr:hypothetical protein [Ktedonobacterales bacterium]
MRHGARTRFTLFLSGMLLFTLVLAACGGSPGGSTSAQTPAQFYKGKTVQIIVPYSPGGGYDQWARLLAPYLQKYLGAGKVEVVNAPGGG